MPTEYPSHGFAALCAPAIAALGLAVLPAAAQQAFPAKPVKLVVGFAAGGPTDVVARAFADHASRALGQPFVVENKPGANTILAAAAVASAPNDGYTLLFAATNHTMIPALYSSQVKFDALRSFLPICSVATSPTVLVVGRSMPVTTLAQYVDRARKEPGRVTAGTPGTGSSGHFATEIFARAQRIDLNHVPYKGAAPVITDLMGGQIDSSFATLGSVLPQLRSGKLAALAVAAPQRSALLPEVPTFTEAGGGSYSADAWYGVLAPAGIPAPVARALERVTAEFAQSAAAAQQLHALGLDTNATCGTAFATQIGREVNTHTQIARDLNLQAP